MGPVALADLKTVSCHKNNGGAFGGVSPINGHLDMASCMAYKGQ